jgi:8-oxo-dGTP pyrophosphatase MutT (NUDIX family)
VDIENLSIQSTLIPIPEPDQSKIHAGRAAVLVPLFFEQGEYSLLLTKRAQHMNHHGGEVAFPGGMWEPGDHFPVFTALREAEEEVRLKTDQVEVVGLLPDSFTRKFTQVTPVVGIVSGDVSLVASPDEIETIFYVPLTVFMADKRIRTDIFNHGGKIHWAPAYEYDGHEIWGFTARVIKDLLKHSFQTHLLREHSAPEKIW